MPRYFAAMADVGILSVDVLACKELKDKDWFSKNDPYVTMTLSGGDGRGGAAQNDNTGGRQVTVRTKTLHGAGKNPVWTNESHDFQIVPQLGLNLEVEVFDYDVSAQAVRRASERGNTPDHCGACSVNRATAAATPSARPCWP